MQRVKLGLDCGLPERLAPAGDGPALIDPAHVAGLAAPPGDNRLQWWIIANFFTPVQGIDPAILQPAIDLANTAIANSQSAIVIDCNPVAFTDTVRHNPAVVGSGYMTGNARVRVAETNGWGIPTGQVQEFTVSFQARADAGQVMSPSKFATSLAGTIATELGVHAVHNGGGFVGLNGVYHNGNATGFQYGRVLEVTVQITQATDANAIAVGANELPLVTPTVTYVP